MKKENEEESGFRVTDRRLFRESGELREDASEHAEKASERPRAAESPRAAAEPPRAEPSPAAEEPAPGTGRRIDFPSYLLSYYSQGLMFLGEVPNPMTNVVEQDLEGARHTIDLLQMLQDKTKGNLTPEEAQLLESVLYELRMKFMAKTRRIKL